ncbi:MAG TPA: outer membrane beta-barrel protein [Burkholderiales bacterium]
MNKKWFASMLGAAAMAVSAGAYAQQPATTGFYIGAEVGNTDVDGADDDVGFKFLGGYQFHRNIAAEVGYGLLYDKGGVEVTTLEAVAVGMFPIANQLYLLGKLGLANVDVEVPGRSDDGIDITWGLGVQYEVTRQLGLRAVWQRYESDDSVDILAVGVTWRF